MRRAWHRLGHFTVPVDAARKDSETHRATHAETNRLRLRGCEASPSMPATLRATGAAFELRALHDVIHGGTAKFVRPYISGRRQAARPCRASTGARKTRWHTRTIR